MNIKDIVRKERNDMLAATDWTQIPDVDLTDNEKASWGVYRQALREIMDNEVSFFDKDRLFWPTPPSKYVLLDGSLPNLHMMRL